MEKIKKHWKEILIALLVLFSLNKCTQSCNRSNQITKQDVRIDSLNKTIAAQNVKIDSLTNKIDLLNKDIQYTTSENDRLKSTNEDLTTIAKKTQEVKVIRVK